jgi:hypothetical protein
MTAVYLLEPWEHMQRVYLEVQRSLELRLLQQQFLFFQQDVYAVLVLQGGRSRKSTENLGIGPETH